MRSKQPYLYLRGVKRLAKHARGDERVHLGIRPYGFHGGNQMALVIYPILLCESVEKLGKKAAFSFVVSINDWEQDALDGIDPRKYPFNVFPRKTILKHVDDEYGCCVSVVDHWEPIIKKNMLEVKRRHPKVSFEFIRNSKIERKAFFKRFLKQTLLDPAEQFAIFKRSSDKKTLNIPVSYAAPICPHCKSPAKEYSLSGQKISFTCAHCHTMTKKEFTILDYWWYHKPLFLARMKVFDIDITISGGDHFSERDFNIRRALIRKYCPRLKEPLMLFSPLVVALDGEKMSKSRSNESYIDMEKLLTLCRSHTGSEFIMKKSLLAKQK